MGISRQGVRDAIKNGEKQLIDYESKLNLTERFKDIKDRIDEIVCEIADFAPVLFM